MTTRPSTVARTPVILLLALGVGACAARPDPQPIDIRQSVAFPSCPALVVADTVITALPQGNEVQIRGGHSLKFPAGAVAAASEYRVRYGPSWRGNSPVRWAEIEIDTVGTAPAEFGAPVEIGIGYAECPALVGEDRPIKIFKTAPTPVEPMGGADLKAERRVVTLTAHLTAFALAM